MRNDQIRGGFDGSVRGMMSPQLQARLAEEEAREAREAREEERSRAQRAEDFQTRGLQGAIADAIQRGEQYHPKMLRGERLGHQPHEFIRLVSDAQDVEDAQREARQRAAFFKWQVEQGELNSGDMSVATVEAQRAEEQRRQDQRARNQVQRGRDLRRRQIIRDARKEALTDTVTLVGGLAQAVDRDRRGW
jgi:hypothetical protein